ncbi:hypothetical protein [Lysinibacillus sphaericus]|uniref:hypothetical protein n=1 Tax=Lysinibacillus sphaericus TaxID=1421 RepID=UPI001CC0FFDB|nr:hypothetical protein [Lysinibacillus sphaericus]
MKTSEIITKYYKGDLVVLKKHEAYYKLAQQLYTEDKCKELDTAFGTSEHNSENGISNFSLENVTTFSEVKKYQGKLLIEMDETEHSVVVKNIIDQLGQFDVSPIGYEIKKEAVVLCWYVLPVLRAFNDYSVLLPDYTDDFLGDEE